MLVNVLLARLFLKLGWNAGLISTGGFFGDKGPAYDDEEVGAGRLPVGRQLGGACALRGGHHGCQSLAAVKAARPAPGDSHHTPLPPAPRAQAKKRCSTNRLWTPKRKVKFNYVNFWIVGAVASLSVIIAGSVFLANQDTHPVSKQGSS